MFRKLLPALLMLPVLLSAPASAQSYFQTGRAFVQHPGVLGAGDASVAVPNYQTAFFYNPAHLAKLGPIRPRITFVGGRLAGSEGIYDQLSFYNDELQPAIEEGINKIPQERRERLYDQALDLLGEPSLVTTDIIGPSVALNLAGVGAGAGLFAQNNVVYSATDAGAGVPLIDIELRSDLIGVASGGIDFSDYGVSGLAAGVTAKYAMRNTTLKSKPLDAFSENERLYLFRGNAIGFDVGVLYETMLPGLTLGATMFDVVGGSFDYKFHTAYDLDFNDVDATGADQTEIAATLARLEDRNTSPSYRIGAALNVSSLLTLGVLSGTSVAVDYVGYSDPQVDQAFLAHLSIGAQTKLARVLALRAGLNQGYATVGAGLHLGPLRLDYAYFGFEGGRVPGQLPQYSHTLQVAFGLF
jgi:hypothetical protein